MFNKSLNGFVSENEERKLQEIISVSKELRDVYEKLKHFPGKHDQFDHAWNAGMVNPYKKKKPSSGSSSKRSRGAKVLNRNQAKGIASPFEASRAAMSQGRTLGVKNPVALAKAVSKASMMLRSWSDKFRAALANNDTKLKEQVTQEFKTLSKELSALSESLSDDTVAQNSFRAIIQSYQDTLSMITPEFKDIFSSYSLFEKDTPDAKLAKKVEEKIDESNKKTEEQDKKAEVKK